MSLGYAIIIVMMVSFLVSMSFNSVSMASIVFTIRPISICVAMIWATLIISRIVCCRRKRRGRIDYHWWRGRRCRIYHYSGKRYAKR